MTLHTPAGDALTFKAGAHSYSQLPTESYSSWRLVVTEDEGASLFSSRELEMFLGWKQSTHLNTGSTLIPVVSTTTDDYGVDGENVLTYDFPEPVSISKIFLFTDALEVNAVNAIEIQYNDSGTWHTELYMNRLSPTNTEFRGSGR